MGSPASAWRTNDGSTMPYWPVCLGPTVLSCDYHFEPLRRFARMRGWQREQLIYGVGGFAKPGVSFEQEYLNTLLLMRLDSGNFTPDQALAFFHRLRAACDIDGGLLIGVDLIKDKAILDAAYDDALGVTAAFNLNLLLHLNQLLGADFKVRDWRHVGFFKAEKNRIEMYLEARAEVTVTWPGAQRRFLAGERIHTENSYKYLPETFLSLLAQAGFGDARLWTDTRGWFAVIHARAV